MNRRDLLKNGGKAAAMAALAPSLLRAGVPVPVPNCVYSKKGLNGVTPNIGTCDDTCANEGMAGHYPNCYYPQYLNLNRSLASAVNSVRNSARGMIGSRSITQAYLNTVNYYNGQWQAHLAVYATQITECLRIQGVANSIYSPASGAQISAVENWAYNNGFNPNTAAAMIEAAMPLASTPVFDPTTQALQQKIMQLPNYQGLDNLYSFNYGVMSSVTAANGLCQWLGNPQTLIETGEKAMAVGGIILGISLSTGPALPFLDTIGAAEAAVGGMFYMVGEMCIL